jgi:tricorn protease
MFQELPADQNSGYLRHPTICGDAVVVVCDDDLWRVNASGGVAHRLTAGLGEPSLPALSPDGRWLAYVGRDEQHPEVYLMPAAGGPARRMTWLGPDVQLRGFTPEGRVLFVTTHGQPFFRNYRAYSLDVSGGLPELLPLGHVNHLAFGPGKARVIGRNTADPARWKRYRGGTAGQLWVDAKGSGEFTRMSSLQGNITCPMWIGDRIYFISDFEGVGNLYSCRPDSSDVRRHTDHDDYYARFAATDGRSIVYQCGARIWRFDPTRDTTTALTISTPGHRTQAARKFVKAEDNLQGVRLHPAGHSLALEVRGKIYSMALWEGAVRQHGRTNNARHRLGQWLADGKTLVAVSDGAGDERILVIDGEGERQLPWDIGRAVSLSAAPFGTRIAISNHRNELMIGDVESGRLDAVDRAEAGQIWDLAWSPDATWLAYPCAMSIRVQAIKLLEVASGKTTLVTEPQFRDWCPAFDPDGKYLYFLSARSFDPVYDMVQFELSFPRAARPYLIALQRDGKQPFEPEPSGMKPKPEGKTEKQGEDEKLGEKKTETKGAGAAVRPVRVDLEGIARRVAAFPVPEGRYGQIAGISGKVLWTEHPVTGSNGRGGHKETAGALHAFDLAKLEPEVVVEKADEFMLAADNATLVVREGKRLRALEAGKKPEVTNASDGPSRKSGWIDLARVRPIVEPRSEWRQMLHEVWRLQRDNFWDAQMSSVDWNDMLARYAPLLDQVATRGELSDLIWELQGELGTSHAYEMLGDHRKPPELTIGQLAADVAWDGEAYRLAHIVRGDTWDATSDSPLNAIGVEAQVAERIVAVNGQLVTRETPPQALLVHQAGTKVELVLARNGTRRTVLVTTLADEVQARYREWVEMKRRWVHTQSQGKVGYLHIPDMMGAGYAEFHRYFPVECDCDGLIVDVRYNRGGHVSQLLLEKVARKRIAYDQQRWGPPVPYPGEAPTGPMVALTNEHAGSDGDIFSHNFKQMGIVPLVRTRTWGGVIGIWPASTDRRNDRHAAGVLLLVRGRRLGDREPTAPIRRSRSTTHHRTLLAAAMRSSKRRWRLRSSWSSSTEALNRASARGRT